MASDDRPAIPRPDRPCGRRRRLDDARRPMRSRASNRSVAQFQWTATLALHDTPPLGPVLVPRPLRAKAPARLSRCAPTHAYLTSSPRRTRAPGEARQRRGVDGHRDVDDTGLSAALLSTLGSVSRDQHSCVEHMRSASRSQQRGAGSPRRGALHRLTSGDPAELPCVGARAAPCDFAGSRRYLAVRRRYGQSDGIWRMIGVA